MRPRLLDLFCGAGGAAMGYHRAGFEVVGVDINPQPNYPFGFVQADAVEFLESNGHAFEAIHASPPCQRFSTASKGWNGDAEAHPDLVGVTRDLLLTMERPYVIENVPGAPLIDPVMLCGSAFGLRVRRHRLFETSFPLEVPPCRHGWQDALPTYAIRQGASKTAPYRMSGIMPVHGTNQLEPELSAIGTLERGQAELFHASVAMGIHWMTKPELNEAIPPAYTEYIGARILTTSDLGVAA